MAAPDPEHQRLLMEIAAQLHRFLKGKPCMVFPAPFAAKLRDRFAGRFCGPDRVNSMR
jgi:hypothetical protein